MYQAIQAVLTALTMLQTPATPAPNGAAPTLELDPPQVMVMPGQPFKVRAKTNASVVFYDVTGVHQAPDDWPLSDRKLNFYGYAPLTNGQFTLTATAFSNDQRTIKKIPVIVGATPAPPGPNPPGPVPDPPNDPLFAELQAIYTANPDPDKAEHKTALASLYRTAGTAALKDKKVQTTGQFLSKLKDAAKLMLPDGAMPKTRDRLAGEFALCLGKSDVPMTDEIRQKASDCLHRLAGLVEALR